MRAARTPSAARSRFRVRVTLLTLLAAAAGALGGVRLVDSSGTPYSWDLDTEQANVVGGEVTYYADPQGTRDIVGGPISDLAAVRAGIASWEIPTTRIRFREDPTRSASSRNATDRVNYVGWATSGVGRMTLAVTFPTRSGDKILDMDVVFNDSDFTWDTRTPGTRGTADIQAIMTHEWGHALGADHNPLQGSTMYYSSAVGATAYRTLSADDRALVGSIYPNDLFAQTTGTLRGRVTRVGASDSRAIHVVAVSLVTNEPEASTLTSPDGTWEITGLPRGAYRVLAAPTIPLQDVMNSYWQSGNTSFLPAVATADGANPGPARTVAVLPQTVSIVPDFTVTAVTSPFEPNDAMAQARQITLGDGVAARLETGGDVDWYAFDAEAGQRVTVSVLGWNLGSRIDPAIALTTAQGVPLQESEDVRPESTSGTREAGPDLDARVIGVPITSTGRHLVKVRNQTVTNTSASFYVLFVTQASEAPSAILTTVEADPPRIDADGAATTRIVVTPRKETGEDVGTGATVTALHDGAGTFDGFTDEGDGTYTGTLTAPLTPGDDHFTVTITSTEGTATLTDALRLVYLGHPDAAATEATLAPRRIAADGAATATVTLLPRDAAGEALGPGRTPAFLVSGTTGTTAGASSDLGDGRYESTLTAGADPGTAAVRVTLGGVTIGPIATLRLGFLLDEVADQATADADTFLVDAALERRVARALRAMQKQTARTVAAVAVGKTKQAVRATRKALAKLLTAEKKAKGTLPALGTREELAQAVRQTATEALGGAVIASGKDQKRVDDAAFLVADGDEFLRVGGVKKAAARYERAYRRVYRLVP